MQDLFTDAKNKLSSSFNALNKEIQEIISNCVDLQELMDLQALNNRFREGVEHFEKI